MNEKEIFIFCGDFFTSNLVLVLEYLQKNYPYVGINNNISFIYITNCLSSKPILQDNPVPITDDDLRSDRYVNSAR